MKRISYYVSRDDYTDAWFIGFDPAITVGVWVGYDQKRTIGVNQTGQVAALPIWIDFMRAYIDGRTDPPAFEPPGNIVFVTVDRLTGQPIEPDARPVTAGPNGGRTVLYPHPGLCHPPGRPEPDGGR